MSSFIPLDAEHSLLGAALIDSSIVERLAATGLQPWHFAVDAHRQIWRAVQALTEQGKPADPVTVTTALGAESEVDLAYLNNLANSVPSAAHAPAYADAILAAAGRREIAAALDHAHQVVRDPAASLDAVRSRITSILELEEQTAAKRKPFELVTVADLETAHTPPPEFIWDGLLPRNVVTLLSAHGGTGKSTLSLMLAVGSALGMPVLGRQVSRERVAYFSGEDGADLLRYRLQHICRNLTVDPAALDGHLHIIDATEGDPRLFVEHPSHRGPQPTATFHALRDFMRRERITLLVVDNASDVFDASEIDRAAVRTFMRRLTVLARECAAGLLLLSHVDKGTSRGDRGSSAEGYSGSTAWHNSARSRLFLSRDKDGALTLEHQKANLGPLQLPMRLVWPQGGLPMVDGATEPMVQAIAERASTRALLKLIHEFTQRGEYISAATTSRTHAAKMLCKEPGYPRLRDGEVFDLLRRAERAGQLQRVTYRGTDRKERERWEVTATGKALADIAATAATAATAEVTAPSAPGAEPAATAATSPGGYGGKERAHFSAAKGASWAA
jgi:KaiC/GvpD/RAD55 family RecA-like ATPase